MPPTMPPSESPPGPGRPPGSQNKIYPEVKTNAPRCRVQACGSTELKVLKRLPDQWYAGERDGKPFTVIVRRRVQCKDCGVVAILTTYQNRKSKKKGKKK